MCYYDVISVQLSSFTLQGDHIRSVVGIEFPCTVGNARVLVVWPKKNKQKEHRAQQKKHNKPKSDKKWAKRTKDECLLWLKFPLLHSFSLSCLPPLVVPFFLFNTYIHHGTDGVKPKSLKLGEYGVNASQNCLHKIWERENKRRGMKKIKRKMRKWKKVREKQEKHNRKKWRGMKERERVRAREFTWFLPAPVAALLLLLLLLCACAWAPPSSSPSSSSSSSSCACRMFETIGSRTAHACCRSLSFYIR